MLNSMKIQIHLFK